MRRLPATVFAVLAVATVGAFYLTQHLKVSNPLISFSRADPPVINPLAGGVCPDLEGKLVSFRRTRVGFFLERTASVVDVYVLNREGHRIAVASGSGRRLIPVFGRYYYFSWGGREFGGKLAPDGSYELQALLKFDGRAFKVGEVRVLSARPAPFISVARAGRRVRIGWTADLYRKVFVLIYRAGGKRLLDRFAVDPRAGDVLWNERLGARPAPRGVYTFALQVENSACTFGTDPAPGAGVFVNR